MDCCAELAHEYVDRRAQRIIPAYINYLEYHRLSGNVRLKRDDPYVDPRKLWRLKAIVASLTRLQKGSVTTSGFIGRRYIKALLVVAGNDWDTTILYPPRRQHNQEQAGRGMTTREAKAHTRDLVRKRTDLLGIRKRHSKRATGGRAYSDQQLEKRVSPTAAYVQSPLSQPRLPGHNQNQYRSARSSVFDTILPRRHQRQL